MILHGSITREITENVLPLREKDAKWKRVDSFCREYGVKKRGKEDRWENPSMEKDSGGLLYGRGPNANLTDKRIEGERTDHLTDLGKTVFVYGQTWSI